ncbi:MAG: CDP-diacylglycerol--glycerol-3-phosphate 3-phosphatidyltransferase [Planctomycetota bacterium]
MNAALTLPNQITIARLGLALIFFFVLSLYSHRAPQPLFLDAATAIFVLAAGSDFLDGYIARKRGLVTPLGRVLDPLVDKVLVCGAFILFVGPAFVDAEGHNVTEVRGWMVVVIVGRELLVTGLRGFNESIGRAFGSSLHGKIKMWMQSIAAPAILFVVAHEGSWLSLSTGRTIKLVLVWSTVVVTALSMGQYLARSRHILEESAAR